jgi:large subunit ribosomal protein L17
MMLRNMVTSLLDHERVQTTLAKAREVRRLADRLIGLAKKGDLHARRQALAILTDKMVVRKLFSDLGPRFEDRTGGFTRVLKAGNRLGDGAPLSVVMLAESIAPGKVETKKTGKKGPPSKKRKTPRTKGKEEAPKPEEEKEQKKPKRRAKKAADRGGPSPEKSAPKKKETKKKGVSQKPKRGSQDSSDSP